MGQVELEESVYENISWIRHAILIQYNLCQLATDTDRPGRQLNTALA